MLNKLSLLALLLALPLTACGSDEEIVEEPDGDAVVVTDPVDDLVDDTLGTGDMVEGVTAQATLEAIPTEGLTAMDPGAAVDNIDAWIDTLTEIPEASGVVEGLQTLKTQLSTNPFDGAAIGATLSSLGEQTTAVAGDDASLQRLGSALSGAGATLTGN